MCRYLSSGDSVKEVAAFSDPASGPGGRQICAKIHIRNAEPSRADGRFSRRAASFFFLDESRLSILLSQPVEVIASGVLLASERSTR